MPKHAVVEATGEDARHGDGARAGATRQGLARAPFPDPHLELGPGDHADELGVDPSGEGGMAFDFGADPQHPVVVDFVDERDAVGVAHRDAVDLEFATGGDQFLAQRGIAGEGGGNFRAFENRFPHVDPHAIGATVDDLELEGQDAATGLDLQFRLAGDAVVVDVLGHAADAIAAHFGFTPVGIEHPHAGIGDLGGADDNQPIGADACVAVTEGDGEGGEIGGECLGEGVDVDIVVSRTVHLGKPHETPLG